MIAEHLLTRKEVAAILTNAGYEPSAKTMAEHSCWKAPCGLHLFVPELPPEAMTCERTLYESMATMDAHARSLAN